MYYSYLTILLGALCIFCFGYCLYFIIGKKDLINLNGITIMDSRYYKW